MREAARSGVAARSDMAAAQSERFARSWKASASARRVRCAQRTPAAQVALRRYFSLFIYARAHEAAYGSTAARRAAPREERAA